MSSDEIKAAMKTILSRIECLGRMERTAEVQVSIAQLCGEYGGLQAELQEAESS